VGRPFGSRWGWVGGHRGAAIRPQVKRQDASECALNGCCNCRLKFFACSSGMQLQFELVRST
jgi:hypothetical protein